MWLWIILAVVVVLVAIVRLAPIDADRWHQPVQGNADKTSRGSAVRVVEAGEDALVQADRAMMMEPVTQRIAGSVEEGRITYVSRSKWWGFPDFTTIEAADGQIRMFARLRFGNRDFGVNAKRLERVKRALQAGG